ncbi:MAG: DUF559 domain-containing protein [Nanoarchaeota archaeon]
MNEETKKKISETKKRKYSSGEVIVWNKGKKRPEFSQEWKDNLSKALKGKRPSENAISKLIERNKTNNPMWNKDIVKKATAKRNYKDIARKTTETKVRAGTFLEYSKRMKENNPMKDPIINAKVNKNPEYMKRRISALIKTPNKKELMVIELLKNNNLEYDFVGDGKIMIGTKNPDFINIKNKKIIEVFGDYWHTKKVRCYEETEEGRIKYFNNYGYKTLVIWESELKDKNKVLEKIIKF